MPAPSPRAALRARMHNGTRSQSASPAAWRIWASLLATDCWSCSRIAMRRPSSTGRASRSGSCLRPSTGERAPRKWFFVSRIRMRRWLPSRRPQRTPFARLWQRAVARACRASSLLRDGSGPARFPTQTWRTARRYVSRSPSVSTAPASCSTPRAPPAAPRACHGHIATNSQRPSRKSRTTATSSASPHSELCQFTTPWACGYCCRRRC